MSGWQTFAALAMFAFIVGMFVCFAYGWYGGMAGCIAGGYMALIVGASAQEDDKE